MEDETITKNGKYEPIDTGAILKALDRTTGLVKKYFCEVCGKPCRTKKLAEWHAAQHKDITDDISYEYEPDATYPTLVRIRMTDGREIVYATDNTHLTRP